MDHQYKIEHPESTERSKHLFMCHNVAQQDADEIIRGLKRPCIVFQSLNAAHAYAVRAPAQDFKNLMSVFAGANVSTYTPTQSLNPIELMYGINMQQAITDYVRRNNTIEENAVYNGADPAFIVGTIDHIQAKRQSDEPLHIFMLRTSANSRAVAHLVSDFTGLDVKFVKHDSLVRELRGQPIDTLGSVEALMEHAEVISPQGDASEIRQRYAVEDDGSQIPSYHFGTQPIGGLSLDR